MGKKAKDWVHDHLGSLIDPETNMLLLEKRQVETGVIRHVIDADIFAEQFASVIESNTKGKAAAMKAVMPKIPDGATKAEREEMLSRGLGFDKYIDAWKQAKLIP